MNGVFDFLLLVAATLLFAWTGMYFVHRRVEKRWRSLACELGFDFTERGRAIVLTGRVDGMPVRIDSEHTDHENRIVHHPRVRVTLPAAVEGLQYLGPREWEADERLTGDAAFDDLVRLRGDPDRIRALFDAEIRDAIRGLCHEGGATSLRKGVLSHIHTRADVPLRRAVEETVAVAAMLRDRQKRMGASQPPPGRDASAVQ